MTNGTDHASDPPPPGDRDLLVAWRDRRDEVAFGRLVARHAGFAVAVARRQLAGLPGADTMAEDAGQAAMVVLARRASEAARHASVRGWLHRVVVLTCGAQRRDLARRRRHERAAGATRLALGGSADGRAAGAGAAGVGAAERWADEELSRLAARDREVLALRYLDGLPIASVAARLGVSPDAAKQRARRALGRLARRLRRRDLIPALAGPGAPSAWAASLLSTPRSPPRPSRSARRSPRRPRPDRASRPAFHDSPRRRSPPAPSRRAGAARRPSRTPIAPEAWRQRAKPGG